MLGQILAEEPLRPMQVIDVDVGNLSAQAPPIDLVVEICLLNLGSELVI